MKSKFFSGVVTEDLKSSSEVGGKTRDNTKIILPSIVDHPVQVNNSVGTVRRRDTVKHRNAIGEGKINTEVISFSLGNNYF